mgnify:CR=1 FL=1
MALSSISAGVGRVEQSILIIDDEASIRRTLAGIFGDEGFRVLLAEDGVAALNLIKAERPSVILLDIWMPGMDGLELLGKIKQIYPEVPVIMISGHATIATAVRATHLGAADFIEKPLDLNATLLAVKRALGQVPPAAQATDSIAVSTDESGRLEIGREWDYSALHRLVFAAQPWAGRRRVQKTLAHSALLYGQGLHSGQKSGLILEPLPANSGIHFVGVSQSTVVPAHVDYVGSTGFATTLKFGGVQAGTTEHLMSALHAYGIANLMIKCDSEVPVMDGSAREFCALFDEVGVQEQEGDWFEIEIKKHIRIDKGREYIELRPADCFIVDYTLDYPEPVGRQHFVFKLESPEHFKNEIAAARTFGFVKDVGALQKQGLAQGGRLDNFVLFGEKGPVNGAMRFPNEPVRHKVLDIIGDLYLLGRPICGQVTAFMTGHSDNIAVLKALKEELVRG